jgi:hypothetical protein
LSSGAKADAISKVEAFKGQQNITVQEVDLWKTGVKSGVMCSLSIETSMEALRLYYFPRQLLDLSCSFFWFYSSFLCTHLWNVKITLSFNCCCLMVLLAFSGVCSRIIYLLLVHYHVQIRFSVKLLELPTTCLLLYFITEKCSSTPPTAAVQVLY